MWRFLKENSTDSSHRLNLLIITIPIGMLIMAIAFHIVWVTLHPIVVIYMGKDHLPEIRVIEIAWVAIGALVGAILGGYLGLLYGKSLNKAEEIKQGTITSDSPVPPVQ